MPTKLPTFYFLWANRGQIDNLFPKNDVHTSKLTRWQRTRPVTAAALRAC
nr:MAG TPA: hypothetical protein [Caudoviricetes sp.]